MDVTKRFKCLDFGDIRLKIEQEFNNISGVALISLPAKNCQYKLLRVLDIVSG